MGLRACLGSPLGFGPQVGGGGAVCGIRSVVSIATSVLTRALCVNIWWLCKQ